MSRRVLSELECLEWEARQQPAPPPRMCEPWELVVARQAELRRNWLPPRGFRRRDVPDLIADFEEPR